ncbi:hypothetical protein RDI58_002328 [Solanum bulbocastanum]|uniref:Uncharacterized protein n=1 Tax=Solanum bulbocastanum TaxID=147425 RepID=A0AAN8U6J7_SOLBU
MYTTCFGNDQFAVSIIDPTENVSIFYRAEKSFTWLWSRTHHRVTHREFCCILPVMIDLMIRWFNMTTSLEEPSKKTSHPQLVVLNRAFKLAEQWVNSMGDSSDDAKPTVVVLESRPPRLGIGAAVPRQSQTVLSNDPAERRLRAKLDAEKRRKLKSSEASIISAKDGKVDEESEDESESKTKAFTRKRPAALPSTLQAKKKK